MAGDPVADLGRVLGGATPPAGVVAGLAEDDLRDLTAAIRDARRRQEGALRAATDGALDQIPRVLRPAVKKALGL